MSHKTLDFNKEHKTPLLRTGQIPKTNLVLSSKLQATLNARKKSAGGRESSAHNTLILFGMKISNNYSKHKVWNKTMAAFKKLLLKIAHILLNHRISKYFKI